MSACPDLDAIAHWYGVPYESTFGHRGFTHSIVFASLVAGLATFIVSRISKPPPIFGLLFAYLFICLASHGMLDALTNGGLGIAFLSPFSNHRYFFPITPIQVAPISISAFFGEWGLRVLWSEFKYIWIPMLVLSGVVFLARGLTKRCP